MSMLPVATRRRSSALKGVSLWMVNSPCEVMVYRPCEVMVYGPCEMMVYGLCEVMVYSPCAMKAIINLLIY